MGANRITMLAHVLGPVAQASPLVNVNMHQPKGTASVLRRRSLIQRFEQTKKNREAEAYRCFKKNKNTY